MSNFDRSQTSKSRMRCFCFGRIFNFHSVDSFQNHESSLIALGSASCEGGSRGHRSALAPEQRFPGEGMMKLFGPQGYRVGACCLQAMLESWGS